MNPARDADQEIESIGLLLTLHQGEKDALLIMRELPNALLLTDDTAARLAARSLGMDVHGTIGILVRSIRTKMRTKEGVIDTLRSIPDKSTLFIKRALLEEVIRQVEDHA